MAAIKSMGWIRDYPDIRDYTEDKQELSTRLIKNGQKDSIHTMLAKMHLAEGEKEKEVPDKIDLTKWCSPVEDQGDIGSCTAHAGIGLLEYFENKSFGTYTNASRLFLYKVTRDLMGWKGDTGATLRSTMAAMVLFGIPPEAYWEYLESKYDDEPSAFLYAFAQNYQALQYFRLDHGDITTKELLEKIKEYLRASIPSMFGFTVYKSYRQAYATGAIPFPVTGEGDEGGHAVVAVGYDDNKIVKNESPGAQEYQGALLIRNSWGTDWGGMGGYLWLPYEYVLRGLAVDFWCVLKNEWVDTNQFGLYV